MKKCVVVSAVALLGLLPEAGRAQEKPAAPSLYQPVVKRRFGSTANDAAAEGEWMCRCGCVSA